MKLKISNYVILKDGAIFLLDDKLFDDCDYPFEGTCTLPSTGDALWRIGDRGAWTPKGIFNKYAGSDVYDVKIQYNKEDNPEYFL